MPLVPVEYRQIGSISFLLRRTAEQLGAPQVTNPGLRKQHKYQISPYEICKESGLLGNQKDIIATVIASSQAIPQSWLSLSPASPARRTPLGPGLLIQIRLNAPLQRLPLIMLLLRRTLLLLIPRQPRHSTADASPNPIAKARSQIAQLALRLARLALLVLARARLLERLVADQVAQRLFARADCLIPGALRAVLVVGCDARGGGGEGTGFGGCVREVVFCVGFGLFAVGGGL